MGIRFKTGRRPAFVTAMPFALALVAWALFAASARANEAVRLRDIQDLPPTGTSVEQATRVEGARVAWADYAAIRRDFPAVAEYSDARLREWLVHEFAFIGSQQPRLDGIRNTPIPRQPSEQKRAFRPSGWHRSAVLEAKLPDGRVIGMVDIKGFGHGEPTASEVTAQAATRPEDLGRLRIRDHSDGLMSLGEAVAELTRQQAAQRLFEMSGQALETVETYAIIHLPLEIHKDHGQKIPAALYLRQSHAGRASGLAIPPGTYSDDHGNRQRTTSGAAVDFGGVVIEDPRLMPNFGPLEGPLPSGDRPDPQRTKAWKYGHETADAYAYRGDTEAIGRHLGEMLGPIEADYRASPARAAHGARARERAARVAELRADGRSVGEVARAVAPSAPSVAGRMAPPPASALDGAIAARSFPQLEGLLLRLQGSSDPGLPSRLEAILGLAPGESAGRPEYSRVMELAASFLPAFSGPEALPAIARAARHPAEQVRREAVRALQGRAGAPAQAILRSLRQDPDPKTRAMARLLLAYHPDPADPADFGLIADTIRRKPLVPGELLGDAVAQLARWEDPRALALLLELSGHPHADQRLFATRGLAKRAGPAALARLLELRADPDHDVGQEALRQLVRREHADGGPALLELLRAGQIRVSDLFGRGFGLRTDPNAAYLARQILDERPPSEPVDRFRLIQLAESARGPVEGCLRQVGRAIRPLGP